MAQISIGKLLPNLKVTLGNDEVEADCLEENKNEFLEKDKKSAHNPDIEIVRSWMENLQSPKIYKNKSGGFTTGLDLISQDNAEILDKRAERFGLEKEEISLPTNISALYESMGISIENRNSAKMKNIRLDSLHMRGVNELNTSEIFHYFRDYGPASVEWINDISCNVVWLDEASCARALIGVSKPLGPKEVKESDQQDADDINIDQKLSPPESNDDQDKESMDVSDDSQEISSTSKSSASFDIPVPPGHWRLGSPHPKAKTVLLRFATKDDKKLPGAEKRSNYYKKYGNPNYGGLRGLISASRKRKIQAAVNRQAIEKQSTPVDTNRSGSPDAHPSDAFKSSKSTQPRMRMYADDEELKTRKIQSSDTFSEKHQSIHSRLGSKYTKDDLCHLGSYYRESRTVGQPVNRDTSGSTDVRQSTKRSWSSGNKIDLRTKLKRHRNNDISNKHRSPLCVGNESGSEE